MRYCEQLAICNIDRWRWKLFQLVKTPRSISVLTLTVGTSHRSMTLAEGKESVAQGLPVVTTVIEAEGMNLRQNYNCFYDAMCLVS